MSMAVVKLGGSTAYHAEMQGWISAVAGSSGPLVLVPGGGPFADQVRDAQAHMRFSDQAAHSMAILAMEQMGLALIDMHPRFVAARSISAIEASLADGCIPVWLPYELCRQAGDIPENWDMTSDSLSAWLARQIGAETLLLVKQTDALADSVEALTEAGVVDPLLPDMLGDKIDLYIAGPQSLNDAGRAFAAGQLPGTKIARRQAVTKGAA